MAALSAFVGIVGIAFSCRFGVAPWPKFSPVCDVAFPKFCPLVRSSIAGRCWWPALK
jgi:hypothetical protein